MVADAANEKLFAGLWRGNLTSPDGATRPLEVRLQPGEALFTSAAGSAAKILWVRFADGKLSGATETRFDPARKAEIYATFEAVIVEGVMHGTVRERVGVEWRDAATFMATRAD